MNQQDQPATTQPDPDASSDGDGSWKDDPITQDPDEDRSVDHVIANTQRRTEEKSADEDDD